MRILLTGASGFIGRHLVNAFKTEGHEIWILGRRNIRSANYVMWDFGSSVPDLIPRCDVILHLAAHVNFGSEFDKLYYQINTFATTALADYARCFQSYFLFPSMIGIHGDHTLIGDQTPIRPANHYSLSKYLGEEVIRRWVDDFSILRIAGVYGLDGPNHLGINRAVSEAYRNGRAPRLIGAGQARRNYICVRDVVKWICWLIKNHNRLSGTNRDILYLAGPEIMTIEEYLIQISEVLLNNLPIERMSGPESKDLIVEPSHAPFDLVEFNSYLNSLRCTD